MHHGTVLAHGSKVVDLAALDTYFGIDECYQYAISYTVCK